MGRRPRPIPKDVRLRRNADRQDRAYRTDPDQYMRRLTNGLDPAPIRPPRGPAGQYQ